MENPEIELIRNTYNVSSASPLTNLFPAFYL